MDKINEEKLFKKIKDVEMHIGKYEQNLILQLIHLYYQEKEKNKKLDRENQAIFETSVCHDDNLLLRVLKEQKQLIEKYEKEQKDKDLEER